MNCRFCNSKLEHTFVDLVSTPASNSFLKKEELNEPESYFPLKVFVCNNCFLVQIDEYKKSDAIFNDEYVYFSSYSTSWLAHSKQYVEMMTTRFGLSESSQVIEIASNDGYLLQYFKEKQIPVLGIEPTANTAAIAEQKGIKSIIDFFGVRLATKLKNEGVTADVLLGNNVLAHVPDINDFVGGMGVILSPKGIITMEFPHLLQLITHKQFDTIYHEHFSYLSLQTVIKIFTAHGLTIFDVEEIPTHGGSLRIFAKNEADERPITENVRKVLNKEKAAGLDNINSYKDFQGKVNKIKNDITRFLIDANEQGKKVVGYGAAAKGNTLLNFAGIKSDLLEFVVDANPAKQGKYLPGTHIPVLAENDLKNAKPDYVLILPWNIKNEITAQLSYIKEWGGEFVVAIPQIEML